MTALGLCLTPSQTQCTPRCNTLRPVCSGCHDKVPPPGWLNRLFSHCSAGWKSKISFSFSSVAQSCPTLCNPMDHSTPGFPVTSPSPRVYSNSCPLNWWCHPIISSSVIPFSSCLLSFPAWGLFQWIGSLHQEAKVLELPLQINPSNEYLGMISFRMDWFDLLTVQGTLKSLLQHHSSKTSILRCSAFFMVQLSHPYMPGSRAP